jgi:hypothetical protein
MAQLALENCTLKFEEHKFIHFFNCAAPLDEESCSYEYSTEKDDLRLVMTVWPFDGHVHTSLYRHGLPDPITESILEGCTHARFYNHSDKSWLEIGRPLVPTSHDEPPLDWGLRIFVEPHFKLELLNKSA